MHLGRGVHSHCCALPCPFAFSPQLFFAAERLIAYLAEHQHYPACHAVIPACACVTVQPDHAFYEHMLLATQEIGVGTEGDKKTAKKQAAQKAIEFLLNYTPPAAPPELEPEETVAQSSSPGMLCLRSLWLLQCCQASPHDVQPARAVQSDVV